MSMDVNSKEAELWSENMRLKSENEQLIGVAQLVIENYYGMGGDEQSVARAARNLLTKLQGADPVTPEKVKAWQTDEG